MSALASSREIPGRSLPTAIRYRAVRAASSCDVNARGTHTWMVPISLSGKEKPGCITPFTV
jgi:hypothetical protein